MITPEMLQNKPGTWYVDARLNNSTWEPGMTLKISTFQTKCLYWNVVTETWRTDGCRVSNICIALPQRVQKCPSCSRSCIPHSNWLHLSKVGFKSTPQLTQCLCNHLTLFGSSFFVMPNYVDITQTTELFATVSQNYVVLALLCAFFALYLVTLLWACYADRRSRFKVSPLFHISHNILVT